uniref:Uncharacterized protein n=1 Tax=Megaselia scalaris TaxID=36166 RepID=T1GG10_MEGSC
MSVSLIRLLRSKQLSRKIKVRIYHQLILSVLLYGTEKNGGLGTIRYVIYNHLDVDLNKTFALGRICRNDGRFCRRFVRNKVKVLIFC